MEKNLPSVVANKAYDLFLQSPLYFDELIKLFAARIELRNDQNIKFLIDLLNKKQKETYEKNAFPEYGALARLLVTIGESNLIIKDIKTQNFNSEYLRLFRYVIEHARDLIIGYSWSAYNVMKYSYNNISKVNRDYIEQVKEIKQELIKIEL